MHSLSERENNPMWGKCVGHALGGHVTSFLWKWKLYEFAFKKQLVGHILNKIIVIKFFKPTPFFSKIMSKFVAGHVTKMWFLKLWIVWFQKLSIPSPRKGFFPRPPQLSRNSSQASYIYLHFWAFENPPTPGISNPFCGGRMDSF